jgi:hypothetical protein
MSSVRDGTFNAIVFEGTGPAQVTRGIHPPITISFTERSVLVCVSQMQQHGSIFWDFYTVDLAGEPGEAVQKLRARWAVPD